MHGPCWTYMFVLQCSYAGCDTVVNVCCICGIAMCNVAFCLLPASLWDLPVTIQEQPQNLIWQHAQRLPKE